MTWRLATKCVIIGVPVLVAVWDLIAYQKGGNQATISYACLEAAIANRGFAVCVALIVGVVLGHLFVPQHVSP